MSDNSKNTKAYVDLLKKELSLIDDDNTQINKPQEFNPKFSHINEFVNQDLDQIGLDDNDFIILDDLYLNKHLPDSFYDKFGRDKNNVSTGNLFDLSKNNPELAKKFLHEYSNSKFEYSEDDDYRPQEGYHKSVEELLDTIWDFEGDELYWILCELEDRFWEQTHAVQIKIIKKIFCDVSLDRTWWCDLMIEDWWDDSVSYYVESAWKLYKEAHCAKLIAKRFPIEYVIEHQEELGRADYQSVCKRLCQHPSFEIDRSRLTTEQYFEIMAENHIKVDDAEADRFLFGYVKQYLNDISEPPKFNMKKFFSNSFFLSDLFNYKERFLELANKFKPSLFLLPKTRYYIILLTKTGNTRTIAKFIAWDKYLRQLVPASQSDEFRMQTDYPCNSEGYLDWSWNQLSELALQSLK